MNNIMVDLETMDAEPTAAILSIGAVKFDFMDNSITDKFQVNVDLASAMQLGLTVGASTIMWWLGQNAMAQAQLGVNAKPIIAALQDFHHFIGADAIVWGNGSDFDNVILANAYHRANYTLPWKYYNNRCYRTIKSLFPDVKMDRVGTYHRAVDDAESQALHLMAIDQAHPGILSVR